MMRGLTIRDTEPLRNLLAFDLKDILGAIGPIVLSLNWRLNGMDCTGESSDEFHRLSDSGELVSGERLVALSEKLLQMIDGECKGFEGDTPDTDKPWLIIRAVDSTVFDVECDDPTVLESVKRNFHDVVDLPT